MVKGQNSSAPAGSIVSTSGSSHDTSIHSNTDSPKSGKPLYAMRVFVAYGRYRQPLDIIQDEKVQDVKERVREAFEIEPDDGPAGVDKQEKKILTLTYAGAALENNWCFTDIGIPSGSTLKAVRKDEIKPTVYIYSVFNDELHPVLQKVNFLTMTVEEFRGIASRKTGLPVGVFRLVNDSNVEMFDCHTLYDYGLTLGDTVKVEVWDGWTDFLNLAMMGFASHMMDNLSSDELVARYQMKVAMYVAAHFGNVDLAVSLLRLGVRADEPIGQHPIRQWCKVNSDHIDNYKAPVHEAAEAGQLGVLRSFVHHNICNVLAKDGYGLTPLNIALRKRQKPCASFLLTKQWSKVSYNKKHSVPLSIYVKIKRWADRGREKAYMIHGQWRSSLKNPRRNLMAGALVGHGVQLDGYSSTMMSSKTAAAMKAKQEAELQRNKRLWNFDEEEKDGDLIQPSTYFKSMNRMKLPKLSKWNRMLNNASNKAAQRVDGETDPQHTQKPTETSETNKPTEGRVDVKSQSRPRSSSNDNSEQRGVKLPPIDKKYLSKIKSISHQNLTTGIKPELEFGKGKKAPSQAHSQGPAAVQKYGSSVLINTSAGAEDRMPAASKSPVKGSVSSQSLDNTNKSKEASRLEGDTSNRNPPRKRKERMKSAILIQKAKAGDSTLPLPMVSIENSPRPFMRDGNEDLTKGTLELFDKYRGMDSRNYAIRCLSVANSFKEKPWLAQVQQAMTIAARGVKKIVNRKPHLFSSDIEPDQQGKVKSLSKSQDSGLEASSSIVTA